MPRERWELWSANNGEWGQLIRNVADLWDRGLTEARPELLREVVEALEYYAAELPLVLADAPPTPADRAATQVDLAERDL